MFFCELVFTFMLVFVVLNVTSPIHANTQYYGACIGLTIIVAAFSIGQVSGACLNPAVYVGTVVSAVADPDNVSIYTHGTWVYFVAPIVASPIAAFINVQ